MTNSIDALAQAFYLDSLQILSPTSSDCPTENSRDYVEECPSTTSTDIRITPAPPTSKDIFTRRKSESHSSVAKEILRGLESLSIDSRVCKVIIQWQAKQLLFKSKGSIELNKTLICYEIQNQVESSEKLQYLVHSLFPRVFEYYMDLPSACHPFASERVYFSKETVSRLPNLHPYISSLKNEEKKAMPAPYHFTSDSLRYIAERIHDERWDDICLSAAVRLLPCATELNIPSLAEVCVKILEEEKSTSFCV